MPVDTTQAIELIGDLPPRRHEVFPVPYRTAVSALHRWGLTRTERERHPPEGVPAAVVYRAGDCAVLRWKNGAGEDLGPLPTIEPDDDLRAVIRPGDIVVVDDSAAMFTSTSASSHDGGSGYSPPVVLPGDGEGVRPERYRADDVLAAKGAVLRIEESVFAQTRTSFRLLAEALAAIDAETGDDAGPDDGNVASRTAKGRGAADRLRRETLAQWLKDQGHTTPSSTMGAAAYKLLTSGDPRCEVTTRTGSRKPARRTDNDGQNKDEFDHGDVRGDVLGDGGELPVRVTLLDRRRAAVDEELRQIWTSAQADVTLVRHQQAVADRAALLGGHLGLAPAMVQALRLAGAHHDDGKVDTRFQVRLAAREGTVLAKSRPGISPERARRNTRNSGLPPDWRHEQLSVVHAWDAVQVDPVADPLLVARLIGTSHGRGRTGFPHTAGELLLPAAPQRVRQIAVDLFDEGMWDELIEATQLRYGVWGCAYLEALLRSADGQVSEEGS
jgi:CRISPR-associated endonuclease/helicase Cas3